MNNAGSVWQQWDLHVHTPASFHWSGKKLQEYSSPERDELCKDIIAQINDADVCAYCIMDYWTFDGFIMLRDYLERNPHATTKRIFAGIELRMEAPVNFRLNTHVLFAEQVLPESLAHFLSHLKMGGPDGKPPSRQNIIEVARGYDDGKLRHHGIKPAERGDDSKMLTLGYETIEVSRESVQKAIETVGAEHCILIQPYGTNDGIERLDWEDHPYSDSSLMKWADCFETRKQSQVELFLGTAKLQKQNIADEFLQNIGGYPKPVFSGSDAHEIAKYGVYPSGRATWLKAQPMFKGLRQVCYEPALRCHIGERPPKLQHVDKNPTKYIKSLRLAKTDGSTLDEHWFDGKEIDLNPGLIAIIGNKGSGKSALADILALAGNSHCSKMEFLNDDRFRGTGNKAQHFTATLTWADGVPNEINLGQDADLLQPERIRYLPQHFIEELCNEIATGNDTNFGRELKKVIFAHVPAERQLGMGTLDELLDYLIEARRQAFTQVQQSVRTLNDSIVRNEQEISEDTLTTYRTALGLKQAELDAFDKTVLPVVEKPADNPNDEKTKGLINQIQVARQELETLRQQLQEVTTQRQTFVAERATLTRLSGHVDNFETSHKTFIDEHHEEFTDAGFHINTIIAVTINRAPLTEAMETATSRLNEIETLINGTPAQDEQKAVPGLQGRVQDCETRITQLQAGLDAPQRAYQAYLRELEIRQTRRAAIVGATDKPETIEYYKDRIKRATEVIPAELNRMRQDRKELVRQLHSELLAIRKAYEELYAPVQKIASQAASAAHAIQLEFDASVATTGFETNFLDFIHRGRKGNFQGDEESKAAVKDLLRAFDFNSTDQVVAFTDAVIRKLSFLEDTPIAIAGQLRDKKKLSDLYNYVFGLDYLEIRYMLRLGGKDISQLSPGEKGALLLVFYLLLDTEEIPIIIDQPEHNLDNESVVRLLVDCIRKARDRRQVMIVTHNPNLAIYCDADQIICCKIDKADGHRISYSTGAIEDYDINEFAVNVLEGTYKAFDNRRKKWHKPRELPVVPI